MVTRRKFIIAVTFAVIAGLAVGATIGRGFLPMKVEVPAEARTVTGTVTIPVTETHTTTVAEKTETYTMTVAEVTETETYRQFW